MYLDNTYLDNTYLIDLIAGENESTCISMYLSGSLSRLHSTFISSENGVKKNTFIEVHIKKEHIYSLCQHT